ncbi:hypothetical protein EJB05_52430, partial [Eragrostis curvula]
MIFAYASLMRHICLDHHNHSIRAIITFHRRSSFAGDLIPLPQVLITDRAGDEAASSFDPV